MSFEKITVKGESFSFVGSRIHAQGAAKNALSLIFHLVLRTIKSINICRADWVHYRRTGR